jgi:hypothetical protein
VGATGIEDEEEEDDDDDDDDDDDAQNSGRRIKSRVTEWAGYIRVHEWKKKCIQSLRWKT